MNKHQKKARIALRKDELKKQEEKYSNLMLFTTIEAMALFFGILLIYKGCMSVPAVLYMRPILLTLTILSALSVIWIAYMIYGKKKDWTAHGVFAVFLNLFVCAYAIWSKYQVRNFCCRAVRSHLHCRCVCLFLYPKQKNKIIRPTC